MNVTVFVATVADTRYPLAGQRFTTLGHLADPQQPRVPSPFDEAALETALKLRDADPATRITVIVCELAPLDALARTLAAHRPDRLVRIDAAELPLHDAVAASEPLSALTRATGAEVVLLGREFGDLDDGALPAALAERLRYRYLSLVQALATRDGRPFLLRERGRNEEWHPLAPALVASVTNDRRSRLRHPLFKNVATAKRAPLPERERPAPASCHVRLETLAVAPPATRATGCRLLEGGPGEQAAALVAYVREAVRT